MTKLFARILVIGIFLLPLGALGNTYLSEMKPASEFTKAVQQRALAKLPAEDGRDEKWAWQGFIGTLEDPVSRMANGDIVYDPTSWDWMKGEAPPTVNPSLWRQHKLLTIHGLFKVTDNIWQVRGIDTTNMTVVRGDAGWVIIDPMATTETAEKAMELVDKHLGKRPITGVVYSHSHIDHFGGIRGVLRDQKEIPPIIAPENFVEETSSEWVMLGNINTRRGMYQWALGMPRNPKGLVGLGLAMAPPDGTIRLIPPNDIIKQTGETRMLDGVTLEFQMVPETEAVAEMNIFIPDHRTYVIPEFAVCGMHNIQTPRGAKARDALQWAAYLTEALNLYGDRSDTLLQGHCWPRFGNEEIKKFIKLQRDNYKLIHDQTVRMMNMGMTHNEIAEVIEPPKSIADEWSTHGYYGTYSHNAKGVFQYYVGWWDGIPAHLEMLPQVEQGKKYVELAGGGKALLKAARKSFRKGEYRWTAELLNHLVFSQPDNKEAKSLLADTYEQLGYQQESAVKRNIYLVGAAELRGKEPHKYWLAIPDLANNVSTESFINLMATRLNPEKIGDAEVKMVFDITDTGEKVLVTVSNTVLVGEGSKTIEDPDILLTGTRNQIKGLFLAQMPLNKMEAAGLKVAGDKAALVVLQEAIEQPPNDFPIVTP